MIAARLGSDVATVPAKVLKAMLAHPLVGDARSRGLLGRDGIDGRRQRG